MQRKDGHVVYNNDVYKFENWYFQIKFLNESNSVY